MIIDSHVHIKGGDFFRHQFDPDETVKMLDAAGIDKACVFSICLPSWESNELTRRAVTGREDRLIPYAHVFPLEGDVAVESLRVAIEEWGFRGLKLHIGEVPGEVSAETFLPFVKQAGELNVPVLLDCIDRPDVLKGCAEGAPSAKIISAHLGSMTDQFMVDQFLGICRTYDNVWLDTSYSSVPWKIRDAVRYCGASKIIFGSDGCAGYYPASIEVAKLRAYISCERDLELIMHENIRALVFG